ncbi:MAG: hypothetical protein ABI654_06560 [Betaproteobacteria bacterium]
MKRLQVPLLAMAVLLAAAAADAQTPVRVRGTITAVEGNLLSVKSREGQDLRMELASDASFSYMKKLSVADVQPGTPLGTSALAGPDGKIVALELHLFPAGRPVPGAGHRPSDLAPGATMTNGMVTAVVEAGNGHELTLSYNECTQRVVVPAGIPIVTSQAGDRSLLVVGQYAFIAATVAADGKMTAQRLQVAKDGVRPPQ